MNMRKFLLFLIFLTSIKGLSQSITVNTSQTPQQLVNTLVESSCLVQISNVTASTGSNFGSANGLGFYQNTNPAFPAGSSGVVLTTGQASLAPGPNTSILSNGGAAPAWGGNADLEAALASAGIAVNSKNATVLQFNFIPNSSSFSMDFLFASEEYGTFQCESNDAFVVLLTNLNTGVTTNVALVPSTLQPVTVQNIRNNSFNSSCPSQNAAYFGAFNGGSNAAGAAINFNGQTVLLNATGTLDPNAAYNIKFIIADDGGTDGTDGDFDSAVFLPAGSLNLGQQLFAQDMTLANGNAACFGQTYVLDTQLNPAIYNFQWLLNGTAIAGATGPSLSVNAPGTYSVTLTRPDISCTVTQSIVVEYTPQINAAQPIDLIKCENGGGIYTYQLSQNTPIVTAGLGAGMIVTYHASQIDAINDANALPAAYDSPSGVTIWTRIENPVTGCYALRSFELLSAPGTVAGQPQNLALCESAQGSGTAIFDLLQQNDAILNGSAPANHTITYHTSLASANADTGAIALPESFTGSNQTIYVRLEQNFDSSCYSIVQFNLTVHPLPVLPASQTINQCNSYTLPVLANGNYFTGNGGTGTMIAGGTTITAPQLLYRYAIDPVTGCSNQTILNVNIISAGTAPANVIACESYILPELTLGEYRTAPAGGGSIIPAGTEITATQTIYYFIPSVASCTQNNNFTVTITNTPVVTELADVVTCNFYTLPTLPNGQRYFTGPNGTGTELSAGSQISATSTIYIFVTVPNNPSCTAESSFNVTVNLLQVVPQPNRSRCNGYTLAPISVGNYYTGPGGTGTMLPAGTVISSSQTVYIYAQSPLDPTCTSESSFFITITPTPDIPVIPNVTTCSNHVLPALTTGQYYTGPGGTGTILPAGTVISSSQTIYAYAVNHAPGGITSCPRERTFTVTIIDVEPYNPGDMTVCGSYTLPALPVGSYFTAPNGPNGNGTQLSAGSSITTTQTIYIYAQSTTTPVCSDETSFTITIKPRPVLPNFNNVVSCGAYTLPALTTGNYFTGPMGTGTMLASGSQISATQQVYVYAETGGTPNCTRQRVFTVTIVTNSIVPANVVTCTTYTLPALSIGQYRTAPAGGGTQIAAGTAIAATQTIYVYVPVTIGTNCTDNYNFSVSIIPPLTADDPADVVTCVDYALPPLTNGSYYTAPNGGGLPLAAGTLITGNQTIYVYNNQPGTINCAVENSFTVTFVTVDVADIADVSVCETGYELPPLTIGNYFTEPNGGGTMLNAGDIISTTSTIYIYAETATTPACADEESFTVTVIPSPVIDTPSNVGVCGNYTLPALTNGNYYTGPGGTGTLLNAGQVISETQTLYIFAETGGIPNCPSEHVFQVVINPAAPVDVTACGEYVLPPLAVGNYFSGPAGTGTPYFAGHVISASQEMYVYVEMTETPNCTDNNSFTITIVPYPVIAPVEDVVMCDSYQLPALPVGNYYTGPNGTGAMLASGSFITSTQEIWIYAQTGTTPNCTTQDSFTVTIFETPLVDARSDVLACEQFILNELLVGNYYTGPGGTGTMLNAGHEITSTQTIYIYGENPLHPECNAENSFLVEVFSITADNPEPAFACDSFTLPALTVGNYYALSGGPNVPGQVMYNAGDVITATTTLYVYAETGGRINCTDENQYVVTIWQTPQVQTTQANVAQCNEAFVLPPLTVGNYYTGPLGTGTMLAAGSSISSPTQIYIYAAAPGSNGQCYTQHGFFVDVNFVNVTAPAGGNWCGYYILPELTLGNYYTGPGGTGTMLNAGDLITESAQLYVYHEAGTTLICSDEDIFEITIIQAPIPNQPEPLVTCEIDNEGHGMFNLIPAMDFALGGQSNAAASIHETLADAEAGVNAIPVPAMYTNPQANFQTLYIRLYSTVTDCHNIVALQLIVNPNPPATEPTDFNVCDNNTDGFAIFNLATKTPEILGTLSPAQFTVEYYTTLQAAQTGVAPIAGITNYNSATTTLFVRVENNATGCFDIVPLQLIVNPLPLATPPTPYTLCDNTNPGDEIEVFDLTTKIPEIIGSQFGINVTFHHSMANAQAGVNAVATPTAYTNNATVETLFARVEVEATGCFRVVLLDVRVEPLPELADITAADVTVCDTDENGIHTFNLVQLAQLLINNGQNIQLSFFENEQNAIDGLFPIVNPEMFTNSEPGTVTVYAVATNIITGCKSNPQAIVITITPAMALPELADLALCDQNSDGITQFNLTQQNNVIENFLGVAPGAATIRYYSSLANAQAGAPMITNAATFNGSNGQEIFVRVENLDPDSECFSITSFQLFVDTPLVLVVPPMYTLCNSSLPNTSPQTEIFDLTTMNNIILGPAGVGQGHIVEYFLSQADAISGSNVIANPESFVNTATIQTLHIRVTTNPGGCVSYTTLTLKVLPLPTPDTTPDALELCDNSNSPDGLESFNLTLSEADIRNNDNSTIITYHVTMEDAENDANAIPDPSNHISATGTIYVRVEANTNNPADPICYQIVELPVIVNPLPAFGVNGVIPPFAICEPDTDGFAIFDLNTHNDEVIAGGDVTGYTFRYYRTEANASANLNALPLIGYQNEIQTQQTVWVRVVNTATGCVNIGSFELFVEEEAVAHDVPNVEICDIDAANDGVTSYDLTQFTATVLNGQPGPAPGQFIVEYYTEDPQANPSATPIADPANFSNVTSPDDQIIYIRVYNDATISKCSDYTSVLIHVERRPEPTLTGGTICVDYLTGEVIRTHTLNTGLDETNTYQWYHNGTLIAGANGPVHYATQAGEYTVVATSPLGCISDPIAPVTVQQSGPAAPIGVGYSVSNYFSNNQVITINVEGFGEYEYRLDDGQWQDSNIFTDVAAGPHQVQVRDVSTDNPCSEFVLTLEGISTVNYPRYFTPNGDGHHETWNIIGLGDDNTDAKIYIYDRYGKLIKQISSQGDGWDGTINGKEMPATDYWFTAIYRETVNGVPVVKEFKAHFSLKR